MDSVCLWLRCPFANSGAADGTSCPVQTQTGDATGDEQPLTPSPKLCTVHLPTPGTLEVVGGMLVVAVIVKKR